jgi:hypothetical protein
MTGVYHLNRFGQRLKRDPDDGQRMRTEVHAL